MVAWFPLQRFNTVLEARHSEIGPENIVIGLVYLGNGWYMDGMNSSKYCGVPLSPVFFVVYKSTMRLYIGLGDFP